jgi:outer membrane protein OmpA-like peptidoglycan-associated protein
MPARFWLAFALMLWTLPAASQPLAEETQGVGGRILELNHTIKPLLATVQDLHFVIVDLGGKPKDLQVRETNTDIRIELAADVLFDFDKADIRSTAAEALGQAAAIIRDHRNRGVRITGHTDAKGNDAYNKKLSEARANSVRNWLETRGALKGVRFTTQGFGAAQPVAPNVRPDGSDDPEGRQKNRRVEIIITKG